jgi:hypothetical protein
MEALLGHRGEREIMAKKSVVWKSRRSDSNVPMTKREIISTVARKKTKGVTKKPASKKTVKDSKKAGKTSKRG